MRPVHVHLKMDNVDYLKKQSWKFSLQVDMKNIVKCCKDFFGYFNTLETQGVMLP